MQLQPRTSDVLRPFLDAVGTAGVIADPADMRRYLNDWTGDYSGSAIAVLRPASVAEVQAIARECAASGIAILPQGGNTGLVSGGIDGSGRRMVVVSLERMNRVRDIDAANFSVRVDAGCVLQSVKDACEAGDCLFPLALGAQGSCQIGGNVATNAGGVNVLRYGMARDLVLGLEVVLPDGELWNGFSGLRKDNRGYDLKQLFIGSEGTLGIVTGVELKLFPRPAVVETAYIGVSSFADAMALFRLARRACSDLLTAFEVIGSECIPLALEADPALPVPVSAPVHVLMEASSSGPIAMRDMVLDFLGKAMEEGLVSDAVLAESGTQARNFWAIREKLVEGQARRGFHVRTDLSVTLSRVPALVEEARRMVAEKYAGWTSLSYGHAGDGNIHFIALPPLGMPAETARPIGAEMLDGLYDLMAAVGGSISAEHGIGRSRRDVFWNALPPAQQRLLRAMKTALDPDNRMNPGCLIPEAELLP